MKWKNRKLTAGFTLLELVVVLAILSIITSLAVRSLDRVEDQQRFETTQQGMQEIETAVLENFVADMGRLPVTKGTTELTLEELWINPGATFDVRTSAVDPQVLVPGGWRGPYLKLPIGATNLLDGWGNAYTSPANASPPDPLTTGYARLRDDSDQAITSAGQPVAIIRHLGANGAFNTADVGYDRDAAVVFLENRFRASIKGSVEIRKVNDPAPVDPTDNVIIRVYGPDPTNPASIKVSSVTIPFATNPVVYEIPLSEGLTVGPRVVRAYFTDTAADTTPYTKSAIKNVTLRAGTNLQELTVDR